MLARSIGLDMTREHAGLWVMVAMTGGALGFMPIMTNGLSWLPPQLVGYGGAMNNVMQRTASALGVAVVGVIVSRSTAQLSADMGAGQTAAQLPQYAQADQGTLLGLYTQTQLRITAIADGNAFVICSWLAVLAALLVLMLKRPPLRSAVVATAAESESPPVPSPDRAVEPSSQPAAAGATASSRS
jgi:hypothetical protein